MLGLLLISGLALAQTPPRDDDRRAVEGVAAAFAEAYRKNDARAIASLWTEEGEHADDRGVHLRGRSAIEKEYAAQFEREPAGTADVTIRSIRFLAKNLAIEEGTLRLSGKGKSLPSSTDFTAWLVREEGRWRIAAVRESGHGIDRLEDLDWLVGVWKGSADDHETTLTIRWDAGKRFLVGDFATMSKGRDAGEGHFRVGADPRGLRSWHFDSDGGHGQALWSRDGHRWILTFRGTTQTGSAAAARNVLSRHSHDEIVWRSTDRVVDGVARPDTPPLKLTRVPAK